MLGGPPLVPFRIRGRGVPAHANLGVVGGVAARAADSDIQSAGRTQTIVLVEYPNSEHLDGRGFEPSPDAPDEFAARVRRDGQPDARPVDNAQPGGVRVATALPKNGGEQDIADRVLRTVSESSFPEDPLRVLRGLARCARDGLRPDATGTWAPKGQTPFLQPQMPGSRQRCSMCGFVAYKMVGKRFCMNKSEARLFFEVQRASFNFASLIGALSNLSMELDEHASVPTPVTLVWDNLQAHRSKEMVAFIAESPWLTVHYLPSYDPNDNPVEGVWSALKGSDLANLCATNRDELGLAASDGLERINDNQSLLWGCLRGTKLDLD
jgi:hypothetical protein